MVDNVELLIVFDTNNVFCKNEESFENIFSHNVEDLLKFLKKYGLIDKVKLCFPQGVIDERIAQVSEKIVNKTNKLIEIQEKVSSFIEGAVKVKSLGEQRTLLRKSADTFIEKNKVIVLGFPKLDLGVVVSEAFGKEPPFWNDGKQEFKDMVIWASIQEYCKENKKSCLLLSANKKEFNKGLLEVNFKG